MSKLDHLLVENKNWAKSVKETDPDFFEKLSHSQNPAYLWIGCSDSRITPVTSFGLLPGEMFVHRNVANLVNHTDINCLSVMQFAVEALQVKDIIVCGHYGCGGVKAALEDSRMGLIDNWLRHIQDTIHKYRADLEAVPEGPLRQDKLCELNVIEQVISVGETTIVQDAWSRGQKLEVHGWMYTIADGHYHDLGVSLEGDDQLRKLRAGTFGREPAR
ncbi:MAG TPA: carbonate dehydratase [Pyrinomonadaceae bacterium]|nr:carbonate dehydratase [Pyrinomonadaceae bacterium]